MVESIKRNVGSNLLLPYPVSFRAIISNELHQGKDGNKPQNVSPPSGDNGNGRDDAESMVSVPVTGGLFIGYGAGMAGLGALSATGVGLLGVAAVGAIACAGMGKDRCLSALKNLHNAWNIKDRLEGKK